jgi:hypothetical protein
LWNNVIVAIDRGDLRLALFLMVWGVVNRILLLGVYIGKCILILGGVLCGIFGFGLLWFF